jgi:hypothetical protein
MKKYYNITHKFATIIKTNLNIEKSKLSTCAIIKNTQIYSYNNASKLLCYVIGNKKE